MDRRVFFIFGTMVEQIISLYNVSKQYQVGQPAGVSDISVSIKKGDFVAIVGESGSGKSTLLKLMYGLLAPTSGEVKFKGSHLAGPHERLIPGHENMKMVTQDFNLSLYAKVYENVAGMLSNADLTAKEQKTWEMLEFMGIETLAEKRIVELSGGEQQRVAIARAIITEPEVLLLDEPFSQIDAVLKNQFRADLRRLCSFLGITIILVSHDPVDGMTLADQMVILKKGRIIETGQPAKIYARPAHTYTAALLGNAFVMPADEARLLGLKPVKAQVMIYPEWVQLKSGWSSRRYEIKDIFFKGFYEELLLERQHVKIRAVNLQTGSFTKGESVQVILNRFLEFDI